MAGAAILAYGATLCGGTRSIADLEKITIEPSAGFISGTGRSHTFVVSGRYRDGFVADLTREAVFSTSEPAVVKLSGQGSVVSLSDGIARTHGEGRKPVRRCGSGGDTRAFQELAV